MEELKKRLQEIKVDAIYGHQKHFIASERKNNWHTFIGVPLLIINISIGTSLFAIFNEGESEWKYIPIIFSYVAAILTGLQTFLKFDKQAVGHHNIGLKYLAVDKQIRNFESQLDSKLINDPQQLMNKIEEYSTIINDLNIAASSYRTSKSDYKKVDISSHKYTSDELGL